MPLLSYEGGGLTQLSYLHADHQGSIVAQSNGTTGEPTINSYDEYGIPATNLVTGEVLNRGRFQYTGQIWIPELGMYHYKARVYSPTLGRFLQTDPIGYDDQFNLYAYVGNDPVNGADPTGQSNDTCGSRLGISASCSGGFTLDGTPGGRGAPTQRPRTFAPMVDATGSGVGGQDNIAFGDAEEFLSNTQDAAAAARRESMRGVRARGRTGEQVVRQNLERQGQRILVSQVYVRDSEGNLRIYDFIVSGGVLGMEGVEAKYGAATRSRRQRTIDTRIRIHGGTVVSRNNPLLPYGSRVQFYTHEINVQIVPER